MPPPEEGMSVAELARLVRDVLVRFEGLTKKLESQFVTKEVLDLYVKNIGIQIQGLDQRLGDAERDKANKSELEGTNTRLGEIEDDKRWLSRAVWGFIILGILSAVFVIGGQVQK